VPYSLRLILVAGRPLNAEEVDGYARAPVEEAQSIFRPGISQLAMAALRQGASSDLRHAPQGGARFALSRARNNSIDWAF
jgi:hypothetical protein